MKEIKIVLGKLLEDWADGKVDNPDKALAEIKKIVLGWVGKDKPIKQNNDDFDNGFESGYNYAKDYIRKKIEGEL